MSDPFQYIRTCHVRKIDPEGRDLVHVKGYTHKNGQAIPEIKTIVAPKRSFYITKPGCQTYNQKKEWEDISVLDQYVCPNYKLDMEVHKVIEGYYPRGGRVYNPRALYDNPYIYGTAISIESLIAHRLIKDFEKSGLRPVHPTVGFFDTEISVNPGREGSFIVGTISHENKVYTAIHKDSFFKLVDGKRVYLQDTTDLQAMNAEVFKDLIDQHGFEFHYYIAEDAVDGLRWLMQQANQNHTDFVGIWNLSYDVEQVIRLCEEQGVDPKDIFSPTDMPENHRFFKYAPDRSKLVSHFTEYWHWVHMSSSFQFYDAMSLYSILRIVKGKEWSYKLDDILEKNIKRTKLKFKDLIDQDSMSSIDWHRTMELNHPLEYILYNQFDVVGLQLMEWKNTDVQSMQQLAGWTSLSQYARQTIRGADVLHFECLKRQRVLGAPGTTMTTEYDKLLGKAIGGTVLAPERVDGVGEAIIEEYPDTITSVSLNTFDIDLSSLYPNLSMASNISRETKTSSLVSIDDKTHEESVILHSHLAAPQENAYHIGMDYFQLPGYQETLALYSEWVKDNQGS